MFKDSQIYVAGHTGLLGSALVRKLKAKGYKNLITRTHDQLDLTDRRSVEDFFCSQKPEYVFLAAGKVGGILSNKTYPADYLHTNIAMQDNVFQAARKAQVKNLVFYGSSCSYPKESLQPVKEEYLLTGPIEQTSQAYATAKISGIIACRVYNEQYQTNCFIALIPASMYGPGDNYDLENSHVLSALIRRFHEAKVNNIPDITLWGSGKPQREFIFSEDVAEASIFAINNVDSMENHHYNIGTGIDYTIKNLARKIADTVGYKGNIFWDTNKSDGTLQKLLDSSKFMSLGWMPKIDLDEGLQTTYQIWQEERGK
ncbi:MAG: GDP-L-fucose synthase [Sedimentisphaerales bacterium]|nr:GDP-L-fucose synthase [Sedimentisphaerales bacterium]